MKDTKSGASATVTGSIFQVGIVLGKKLNFRVSVLVWYCNIFFECVVLVLVLDGVR